MLEAAGERGTGGAVRWGAAGAKLAAVGACLGRNLTKSLTRGMGFRLRMSGMLSIMISPPPGLQERGESAGKGKLRQEGAACCRPTVTQHFRELRNGLGWKGP